MSDDAPPSRRDGPRVWIAPATPDDIPAYQRAVELSVVRLSRFGRPDAAGLPGLLALQSRQHRTWLIHARHPFGGHDLVGKVNVANVIRGRGLMATIGYDAFDPYAGRGLMREGLSLVVEASFDDEPAGMGLHRLEANVQPMNVRSAALVRSLGFVHEGFARDLLYLPDAAGDDGWRDHDRYAITAEDWPAEPYRLATARRVVALINGIPGSGKTTLGRALSARLGVPLFAKDTIREAIGEAVGSAANNPAPLGRAVGKGSAQALFSLLGLAPTGAILESYWSSDLAVSVRRQLTLARIDPALVPQLWCDLPVGLARQRYEDRAFDGDRHGVHGPQHDQQAMWDQLEHAEPMALGGPILRVDTTEPLTQAALTDLALRIRAAGQ